MVANCVKFEEQEAGDLPINAIFVWQCNMYAVMKESDDDNFITVRRIASGWCSNPDNRWLQGIMPEEQFNGYCPVLALMYEAKP